MIPGMKFKPSLQVFVAALLLNVRSFPWRGTALTLRDRFREDRLGLTASSLTFTTSIALVPFFTVALAVFTAFPMFATFQSALQGWLVRSLIPDNIARQVLGYLTQFSSQANKLGVLGLAIVLVTALALILTIDRTLNNIWRVKKARSLTQRIFIYWAAITLGPLLLGASVALTSYALTASRGLVGAMPGSLNLLIDSVQFVLVAVGMASLYHYVPNTFVKWGHALAGGVFVAAGIALAKNGLALYLNAVPTYSMVYGAFATLPILLVWIYLSWVIVLLGAVIAAYMPSLLAGVARRDNGNGWQFQLALEVLQQLARASATTNRGVSASQLVDHLQVDSLQLEPVLETLVTLDWVGKLDEAGADAEARYVMLASPAVTPLEPLVQALLLEQVPSTRKVWDKAGLPHLLLADAL
jgi:membrane protein